MATLEKIRSKAGLLIFIVAFALLCFIVGDFLTNFTSLFHRNQTLVGKVNGIELQYQDFEEEYKQISEMAKMQRGMNSDDASLRAETFASFKQNALFASEAEACGLSVTTKELTDATIGEHPDMYLVQSGFFTDQQGRFDKNAVARIVEEVNRDPNSISDPNMRAQFVERQNAERTVWFSLERTIKQSRLANKVFSSLVNAMSAPKAEAEFLSSLSAKESDALVARKYYADVQEDVTVDDAEVKSYYDKYKEYKFKGESYRDIQVIALPIQPSANDIKEGYNEMDSLRNILKNTSDVEKLNLLFESASERNYQYTSVYAKPDRYDRAFVEFAKTGVKGQVSDIVTDEQQGLYKCAKILENPVTRPDSVRFSLIAVTGTDSLSAIKRADSIANAARNGADFAKLVADFSADKNAAANAGDQGWIQEGLVSLNNFDQNAFNSPVGSIFTVSNSSVAFVVKITDKTKPVLKAKMSILATRLEPSSATIDSLDQLANDFIVANKTAAEFVENAAKQGLQARPIEHLTQNQPTTYVLQGSRPLIKWAFENNEGAVSDVITDVPGYYILCALTKVVDAKDNILPLEGVKDNIKTELIKEKKAEMLVAQMNGKALAEIGKVDTVKDVRFNNNFVPNMGPEASLAAAICNAKPGELSKPIKGNSGVFVFQKTAERESSVPAIDQKALNDAVRSSVSRNLMKVLEDKADIENNSYRFF
ncbi:MAG: SurA N-terminal domain-containing protein [Paludibacteraceae bacterium]|nr:SurA N-terminal domain-containing protein [Paludibacteraceae bacterium]